MRRSFDSVLDLIDFGRYKEAGEELERQLTTEASLLRLLLETETDSPEDVIERLKPIRDGYLSNRERVLSLFILGRAAYMRGHAEGLTHLRQAVKLAERCNDPKLLARAQTRLTRFVLHRVGVEASMPELALLRRRAHAAGDMHSVAAFHCLVAEIEMKRGRYGAAARHLRVAESLSADTADVGMTASINRLVANAALVASDPRTGIPAVHRAVELLEREGARFSLMASLTTLADLDLMIGNLDEAESAAQRALALKTGRSGTLACLDTLVKVDLSRRDLVAAAGHLAAIDALGAFGNDDYYWLWHVPTRARYLIHNGQGRDARALLHQHKTAAAKAADHRLLARYVLGDVEALVSVGDVAGAAHALADAVTELPTITLEDLIQINALASNLSPRHTEHFHMRAGRLQDVGFASAMIKGEFARTFGAAPEFAALHDTATLLAVGPHSELLAHEVAALLTTTGCAAAVSVTSESEATATDDAQRVPLVRMSADNATHVVVNGRPALDVDSQIALMGVRLIARAAAELANSRQRDRLEPSLWPEMLSEEVFGMVVAAASMKELLEITRRVAVSAATVLITGESGTGKELFARAIHEASQRAPKPFIPFNCSAVSREMLASQLFGYRRGAFTGAHDSFPGVIRAAAGGTLFLDEVGELPLDVQPKLLRFLESGEVHPLGEPRPVLVDVRVVSATNADLEQMVADGRFREDLFYRLNVVRLRVPPLRERREEIPLLVNYFVDKFSRESQRSAIRVAEETMEYLVLFNWPGNVRQLANEIRRIVAFAESGAVLMPEHLSQEIASSRRTIGASKRAAGPSEFVVRMDQPLAAALGHVERSMVQYALATAGDRLEDAARMLGLSRKGLYLKRQRLNLDPTPGDKREKSASNAG